MVNISQFTRRKRVRNIPLNWYRAILSHFVNKRDQEPYASLSRTQLFLSHVILCGHTLLISVTSPWGWIAWRLKNEPNTAATAILNNEHPSVPPPLTEAQKFERTKQREKTLYVCMYIYIYILCSDGRMDASVLCNGQCSELLYCILFHAF
jgi:hypothetical protein